MQLGKTAASTCMSEMEIIRATSYHRRDFDLAVTRTNPDDHNRVRSSLLRTARATSSTSTLGNLQSLPLEIIYKICYLLDIRSLFNFRHVSRRAQQIVRGTRGYELVITHALEALCVTVRTNIAPWFTLTDLFTVLCTRDCHLCGSFGGFLFLPLFTRCCFSCIREDSLPSILLYSIVKKRVKMSSVPTVKSLPGAYSMEEIVRKRRVQIAATEFVSRLSLYKEDEITQATPRGRALLCYMVTTSLPYLDTESGGIQNGICCGGCQIALERDLASSRVKSNACVLRDKVYSYDEFTQHFRECPDAQNLWKLRNQGVDITNLSEFVRRGGHFKERDIIMSFNSK
ncbi:Cyclin-like F-box [Penicillium camemberti]|uniref:Cyclin-like F-box n=1 Tax=Penicillium camemberti (strain FM 013) TaxID=1429867 RepID=A0A0G4PMV9_PENC3|nr:Cyclin-like F-box [Penicillium camemberti]